MSKEEKKLTYEELEAYTQQALNQAKHIQEENFKLKQLLSELKNHINYNDINCAFRVLDHKELFSKDFIDKVILRLETILTPNTEIEKGLEGDVIDSKDSK